MGMHAAHAIISGMGGMRTAGDLVARMQLNRGMRIDAAKMYVAENDLGHFALELVKKIEKEWVKKGG